MNLSELFRLLISLSLSGSVLALGLLLIKLLFKQRLKANWHYYLWFLLVFLRFWAKIASTFRVEKTQNYYFPTDYR